MDRSGRRFFRLFAAHPRRVALVVLAAAAWIGTAAPAAAAAKFHLEEASIDDIQQGIKSGQITCEGLVQAYIKRIKAYNGACTRLVTPKGELIAAATGATRGAAPVQFPTQTVPASEMLPDLQQYTGLPLEFGRMEATASNAAVQQQYGMVAGVPNAGQLNAYETLNLRGERSQSCSADCDAASGPLPAHCPKECDSFRKQPDAVELAAQMDAKYGSKPDLDKLPMYCTVISVKNWYDVKDMRSTGGNDVHYAMDAAPWDMKVVAQLRKKGAIMIGVTVASEPSFNGTKGKSRSKTNYIATNNVRSSWGGNACNPYDTARTPGGSSGGAGASVAANLATCAICETTGGSCRIPANANSVASFVTTKGLTSEFGSSTAGFINHRPGILCRSLGDAARVVDAVKDPKDGWYDSHDFFTAQPRTLGAQAPYASAVVKNLKAGDKRLKGLRIGIVREYMVKHSPNDAAISDSPTASSRRCCATASAPSWWNRSTRSGRTIPPSPT